MQDDVRRIGRSAAVSAVLALTTAAMAACASNGTVGGPNPLVGKTTGTATATKAPSPTNQSFAAGLQGSSATSATSSSAADATVSQSEAAAALTAYQNANNTVNAAMDLQGEAKIETGSLLDLDRASMLYAEGVGGTEAERAKAPQSFTKPQFYIPRSASYPRVFFVTVDVVQSGSPDAGALLHFTQDHPGAPWLADTMVALTPGKQWPAFAVGSDGLLDYTGTMMNELPLATVDLVAADRKMLSDNNAGQPGSPFAGDDVTTAERKWIQAGTDNVSPASVQMTITTAVTPLPTYLPLKDGGELAIYGTKVALKATQAGRTFTFGDQGWAKVAGTGSVVGGFTTDSVWMVAAIDPPDKSAKIQKIAYSGGLVSVEH